METEKKENQTLLNIPTAIVIAGAIIAGAVIYTKAPSNIGKQIANVDDSSFEQQFKAITESDHILGNPEAKIKIVEYSDTSCPFCKVFHNTMIKVMNDYGKSGNILPETAGD